MITKTIRTIIALPFLLVAWIPWAIFISAAALCDWVVDGEIEKENRAAVKRWLLFPYYAIKAIWKK